MALILTREPMFTDEALDDAVEKAEWLPPLLVDDLLAQDATFMLSADGAVGKSIITINAFAAMSAGLPIWGQFECARPLRVVLVLGERTWREPMRRLKRIRARVPYNRKNLFITSAFSGSCDLTREEHAEELTRYIMRVCPEPDVVGLEPLYPFVSGAISEDRVGNQLTRCLSRMKEAMKCAMWLTHHNTKPRLADDGKLAQLPNRFFGSNWLYAHITAQYAAERETATRTILRCMKDNWGCQLPMIPLEYDPEDDTVFMTDASGPKERAARLHAYLKQRESDQMTFTKADVVEACGISAPHFYRLIKTPPWTGRVSNTSAHRGSALYRIIIS